LLTRLRVLPPASQVDGKGTKFLVTCGRCSCLNHEISRQPGDIEVIGNGEIRERYRNHPGKVTLWSRTHQPRRQKAEHEGYGQQDQAKKPVYQADPAEVASLRPRHTERLLGSLHKTCSALHAANCRQREIPVGRGPETTNEGK